MNITMVAGFVHLYHIWGLYGLLTALFFGRAAHRSWRKAGGAWQTALPDALRTTRETFGPIGSDWVRLFKWFCVGLFSFSLKRGRAGWPVIDTFWPEPAAKKWPPDQTLLLGITLGGAARFATAMYWAEKNVGWMTENSVLIPAIPIVWMIIADHNHQLTAFPKRPFIARLLLSAAMLWVALGLLNICPLRAH